MVSSRVVAATLAVCACLVVAVHADVCGTGTQFTVPGASFDITGLLRSNDQPDYSVEDVDLPCETIANQKNYTYVFNVCGDVQQKPAYCDGTAPAFQYDPHATPARCYVAGQHATYSLIDSTDPSKGIELMYTGGAQCNSAPNGGAPPARSLTIRIGCANIQNPVPTTANEVSHCAYLVEMDSFYGCPLECPVGGEARGVCSDHGVCAWDQSNARAHCFCDEGYTGADCSSVDKGTKSSGTSGAVIGLLVTVLLVAVVLGVVLFFVIRMLRAYRQDAHNYMAMHNQDLGTQDI